VRGDSIRDLYAKALALFGLGLLAGIGALVDYWPTRAALPFVAPLTPRVDLAFAAQPGPADLLSAAVQPPPPARPAITGFRPLPAIRPGAAALPMGSPVTLAAPAPPAATAPAAPLIALASEPAAPAPSAQMIILPPLAGPVITSAWPADAEDSSLLDGAKRTGASILRTTAKTGASIFDAVRMLGGTIGRALPN
jgi:hypothetical protein